MTTTHLPDPARPAPSTLLGPADAAGRWPCPSPWHPPGGHDASVLAGAPASTWWCVTCGDGGGVRDLALLLATGAVGRSRRLLAEATEAASSGSAGVGPASRGASVAPLDLVLERGAADAGTELAAVTDEVTVDGLSPECTVGDLAAVLGESEAAGLRVDGRWWPATATLAAAGVGRGSRVGTARPVEAGAVPSTDGEPAPVVHAVAVAGAAGALVGLAPGRHRVGASLVTVAPDGRAFARPLVAPGDAVAAVLEVRPGPPPVDAPIVTAPGGSPWTRAVHRPPRPAAPPSPAPVPPSPTVAGEGSRPAIGGLVPVVVSVLGAALGAILLHQPLFLLLSLVGALATVAAHAQGRSAARRDRTRRARARRADVARWWGLVADAHAAARSAARAVDELAEAVARARTGSARVWERRPHHVDAHTVVLGRGDVPWADRPPDLLAGEALPASAAGSSAAAAPPVVDVLADVPVTLALAPGTVLGIVGPRPAARALARALLAQLVVHHGPADVGLAVVTDDGRPWRWTTWLPHALDAPAVGAADGDRSLGAVLRRERPDEHTVVLVVDGGALVAARTSLARSALAGRHGPVAALVLVTSAHELPASCTHTVHLTDAGAVVRAVAAPADDHGQPFAPAGLDLATVTEVARRLARFDDPDRHDRAGELPTRLGLLDLLPPGAADVDGIVAAWAAAGPDPPPRTTIGVAVDGPVELDLERDGPHALVAGTTGAGKSELLRTLVVGLALHTPPEAVTFLLVDYKGGAAFDACAALPHVVGVVTDLDDVLAERALRSLEAELRRREQRLRRAGVADLRAYRAHAAVAAEGTEPMPRLVVVVDEFATLAAELPGFLASLVGVAQRGRSLGVHLVLATQRPGASLSDDIRANTNLRIALRVPDATTSLDVVGDATAASFDRARPGRAAIRFGPGELLTVQTACSSMAAHVRSRPRVRPRLHGASTHASAPASAPTADHDADTVALAALVAAVQAAHERTGHPAPVRPWLDPLPLDLALADLPPGDVGLLDDPDVPCHRPLRAPGAEGVLAVLGPAASVSAVLVAVAIDALRVGASSPTGRHVYVVAADVTRWDALAAHHDVAVVAAGDRERVERLAGALAAPDGLTAPDRPPALLVIDGVGALREALDDAAGERAWQAVARTLGAPGTEAVLSLERVGALPAALAPKLARRWVAAGTDPADAALWSAVPPPVRAGAAPPLGRIVDVGAALVGQVAWGGVLPVPSATTSLAPLAGDPLPAVVQVASLPAAVRSDGTWHLPVGLLDGVVSRPAVLRVPAGEHVLVVAPARGGATNVLAVLAHQIGVAAPTVPVLVVRSRRGPPTLDAGASASDANHRRPVLLAPHEPLADVVWPSGPFVLLVDDADAVDEHGAVLPGLLRRPDVLVVAAGRPEALRVAYGSWLTLVRRSRLGLLLRPDPDLDGDLLGAVLPRRRGGTWPAGRGYLVDDHGPHVVQVASWVATVAPEVTRPPPDQVVHP